MASNQRPDEEGITTGRLLACCSLLVDSNRDLMKKGLRLLHPSGSPTRGHSNQRPDEEGITTPHLSLFSSGCCIQTSRPDEEGITTHGIVQSTFTTRIQTRDLMKKGLRPVDTVATRDRFEIQTRDLMKKGLRPIEGQRWMGQIYSNQRPDEEGITTRCRARLTPGSRFKPET